MKIIEKFYKKYLFNYLKKKYKDIKYSIDNDSSGDGVSGWISVDKGEIESRKIYAILTRHGENIDTQKCCLQRDDVRHVGLHKDGRCGFFFSRKKLALTEGNLYKVSFILDFNQIGSGEVFFGKPEIVANLFHSYEFLPRNDFRILECSHDELLHTSSSDIQFIKKILIRLRRGKRAYCSRLSFKGETYKSQSKDWNLLRAFVIAYAQLIVQNLHPRNIWSIVDTFVDYGSNGEESAALSLSNILSQERFAQTLICIYDFIEKKEVISSYQLPYWGGLTNRLDEDDAYDIFIARNLELLTKYPIIKFFFIYFLLKMLNEKKSILGENISHSNYFSKMSDFYKNAFASFKLDSLFQIINKNNSEKYLNTLIKKSVFK